MILILSEILQLDGNETVSEDMSEVLFVVMASIHVRSVGYMTTNYSSKLIF